MPRIVVIGGVAAGMSAASQAKRRLPDAEVVALERGAYVSYGACGMPYNIEDAGRDIEDLVVFTPERFREERGIDVRTRHEAIAIETAAKQVKVLDRDRDRDYALEYDELVIATGATAFKPPFEGLDLPGVFVLRDLTHGAAIKRYLESNTPARAVIVGGGYIGMEMAEALTARGLAVTVLEMMDQVVPGWHPTIADTVRKTLGEHDVAVESGVRVERIGTRDGGLEVQTGGRVFPCDMVLVSVGVRPNVNLARAAGIKLGKTGAIAVDDHMRTSTPHVYAAGDCAEAFHRVAEEPAYLPLGDTANKQGKVAGANAAGGDEAFGGIVGSAGFKVFELEVARTGFGQSEIDRLGLKAVAATSKHASFAHGYPNPKPIQTVLFAEVGSGRLLGAQMVGAGVVGKRIDVFATALHAGMTVAEVEGLDLAYAPPISPVYDPILIAATVTRKALAEAR
jgi:NADPH-dependent 2,4-dienoyl-CoA reductase/sulfur reductase-like enzyme